MAERELPLHAKIRAELESHISEGRWPPGTRVPTEAELGQQFGVSRITVQRALRDLAELGLLVRYRRRGTFVARTVSEHNLLRSAGLLVSGPEMPGEHRVLAAKVVPQQEAWIVERLGRYDSTLRAGLHLLMPFVDTVRYLLPVRVRDQAEGAMQRLLTGGPAARRESRIGVLLTPELE